MFSDGQAQVVYEPLDQTVYSYLQRTYVKGYHTENLDVIPLNKKRILRCLRTIQQNISLLTPTEKEELFFYLSNYSEIDNKFFKKPWHLYEVVDSNFALTLDPIIGIRKSNEVFHRFSGAKLSGQIGNQIGYFFHFTENEESGNNIDLSKNNIPTTGINIYKRTKSSIEYSDIRASIGTHWKWGDIAIGKDYINWGYGQRSKLIFSNKAPSYPFIRLDIYPTDWLRFYYFHGWLQSDILDSLRSYDSRMPDGVMRRNIYREKYIAAHMVSLTPVSNLNFSFGESIIYSDISPNLLFLNPLMFFRAADHYLTTKEIGDGNNSQIFFNADYRALRMVEVYGSLFIDEIVMGAIFDETKARNQAGYTLGFIFIPTLNPDFTLTGEYTRILPWVYSNFVQTQTYESDRYLLGHYIGQNADQIYLRLDYRMYPQTRISLFYDYIRKGGLADIQYQYQLPSLPFLYGTVTRHTLYGIDMVYEPYHDARIGIVGSFDTRYNDRYRIEFKVSYGLY